MKAELRKAEYEQICAMLQGTHEDRQFALHLIKLINPVTDIVPLVILLQKLTPEEQALLKEDGETGIKVESLKNKNTLELLGLCKKQFHEEIVIERYVSFTLGKAIKATRIPIKE